MSHTDSPSRLALYHFPASGNCRIVRLALAEKGLTYERIEIDVVKGGNRDADFLRLNPRGKVPVLLDRAPHPGAEAPLVLTEASVINEYLEEAFPTPPLMPPEPEARAKVRQLVHLFDTELAPATGLLIIEKLLKPPAEQRADFVAERQKLTRELLGRLIGMMEKGPYLAGDYSLADVSYAPVLAVMAPCGIILEREFPPLASWLSAIKQRPSYAASER